MRLSCGLHLAWFNCDEPQIEVAENLRCDCGMESNLLDVGFPPLSSGKQAFVAAVGTEACLEHPRYAVLEPVRTFDNTALTDWCQRRLVPEAAVYSDGLACFARCTDEGHAHTVLATGV